MCELLALKFASWLSPVFELWIYDRIQELLTKGFTKLDTKEPTAMATTLRLLADSIEQQATITAEHEKRLLEIESKIISSDENYYTIAGFCSLHGVDCPLPVAKAYGKIASSLSRERDLEMGTAHDERYGRVNTYHKSVLNDAILSKKG